MKNLFFTLLAIGTIFNSIDGFCRQTTNFTETKNVGTQELISKYKDGKVLFVRHDSTFIAELDDEGQLQNITYTTDLKKIEHDGQVSYGSKSGALYYTQSGKLFTARQKKNGQWVEVQIRTDRMHELAERGLAAHWKYKTGESSESELDKWLRDIKEALSHPDQNAMEFLGTFKLNLFAQEVFVFTPKGEIKTMPQNATALDFAYQLHSELGDHCIGAKVNHSLVPLSYILQSGDQIEILTSANQFPQEEWLDFVTTAKAQSCLRNYFKKEERQYERNGEKIFNEAVDLLGAGGIRFTALQRTLNYYHLHQPAMLYMQIGQGNIQMTNLKDIIYPKKSLWKRINPFATSNDDAVTPEEEPKNTADLSKALLQKKKNNKKIVLTDENLGKDYFLADCCHPIPGDEVLGYMDDNGKIYIHKVDCEEAQLLKTSHGERIFSATWGTHRVQSYVETISLFGIDKLGVFIKVLSIITIDFHINVRSINAMSEDGIFKGTIDLFIYDKQELDDLFEALMKLEDVKSVKRVEQTTN